MRPWFSVCTGSSSNGCQGAEVCTSRPEFPSRPLLPVLCDPPQGPCHQGGGIPAGHAMPGNAVGSTLRPGSASQRRCLAAWPNAREGNGPVEKRGPVEGGRKVIRPARNLPRSEHRGEGPHGTIRGFPRCPRCTSDEQVDLAEYRVERGGNPHLARSRDASYVEAPRQICRRYAAVWLGPCVSPKTKTTVAALQGLQKEPSLATKRVRP
jgi:hypothetical protein